MADAQITVQVDVAGADQLQDLGNNVKEAGDNAKTAGDSFSSLGKNITGIISSIGLFSNGLFSLADAFDSVEKADLRVDRANKTVREALQKRDKIQADLNKTTKSGLEIEKLYDGTLVTTIDGQKKMVSVMQDGTLAVKDSNGQWQRLVTVTKDAKGNLIATDGTFRSLVSTLKDGTSVYKDAAGNIQVLDDGQKKSKFTVQDLQDANTDLNTAIERQNIAVKADEKAHAELLPRLASAATQMVGGAASAVQLGKELLGMGTKASDSAKDVDTHTKAQGSLLSTLGKVAIPLAAIGAAYLILKDNIGGSRDALEQFGAQIGQAIPALQPFLKVIGDIGRGILGLGFGNLNKDLQELQAQLAPIFNTLKQKFDEMANAAQTFIQQIIRGDLSGALNTLVQSATKLATDISNAIKSVDWSLVWQGLKDAWSSTLQWFASAGANLVKSISDSIKNTDWNAVGTSIAQGISNAISFTDEMIRIVLSRFTAAWKTAVEGYDWKTTTDIIVDHMKSSFDSNVQGFTAIGQSILKGIQNILSGKGGAAASDWGPVGNAIIAGVGDGTQKGDWSVVGKNILGAMQATFKTNQEGFSAIGQAILDGIIGAIVQLGNAAAAFGQAIADKVTAGMQQLKVDFSSAGQKILDGIITAIVQLGNAAAAFAQAIGDKVRAGLEQLKVDASKGAQKLMDDFITAIVNLPNAAAGLAQAIGDQIKKGLDQAVKDLTSTDLGKVAGDLWKKFNDAIKSVFSGQSASAKPGGGGVTGGFTFISDLLTPIQGIQDKLKEITDKKWKIDISADTKPAKDALQQVQNSVNTLIGQHLTISLTADTGAAASALSALTSQFITPLKTPITITPQANTGAATSALSTFMSQYITPLKTPITITPQANTGAATSALSVFVSQYITPLKQPITITPQANTGAATSALSVFVSQYITPLKQPITITPQANTGAATSALNVFISQFITPLKQPITITPQANTGAATSALQQLINVITQVKQPITITPQANTGAATSALQQVINVINQIKQPITITPQANTGAATSALQQLINIENQLRQTVTITVTANTGPAASAINALQQQLNGLRSAGTAQGVPIGFARYGGDFSLGGGGFSKMQPGEQLHAARGGSFVVTRRTKIANLTVGEGDKPELVTFVPGAGRNGMGMLHVAPMKKFFAQAGGSFGFGPGGTVTPGFGPGGGMPTYGFGPGGTVTPGFGPGGGPTGYPTFPGGDTGGGGIPNPPSNIPPPNDAMGQLTGLVPLMSSMLQTERQQLSVDKDQNRGLDNIASIFHKLATSGSPQLFAQAGGMFNFAAGGPAFMGGLIPGYTSLPQTGGPIDYGAGLPPIVQGQGGVPVTQPGQYGAPDFGAILGGGSPFGGFNMQGGYSTLPQTGQPIDYGAGLPPLIQGQGGVPVTSISQEGPITPASSPTGLGSGGGGGVSPYEMASLTGNAVASEIEPGQKQMQIDMSSLLAMIRKLLRQIGTREVNANLMIDGQKMANTVSKYIGSGAYGGR